MKGSFLGAALVGVLSASASFASSPNLSSGFSQPIAGPPADAEGADGGRGIRVASAARMGAAFLSEERQSLFLPVGEGGEGGEGGRGKRRSVRSPGYAPSYVADPYRSSYRSYSPYSQSCRTIERQVWDRSYGWVIRRERVCY